MSKSQTDSDKAEEVLKFIIIFFFCFLSYLPSVFALGYIGYMNTILNWISIALIIFTIVLACWFYGSTSHLFHFRNKKSKKTSKAEIDDLFTATRGSDYY